MSESWKALFELRRLTFGKLDIAEGKEEAGEWEADLQAPIKPKLVIPVELPDLEGEWDLL